MATAAERLTAGEIHELVEQNAEEELGRRSSALAFSGLAAGIAMGLSGLGTAAALAILGTGEWARFVSAMLYPIGFVAVIVGRSQLFTENTLYPVALLLTRRSRTVAEETARLWVLVFAANVVGSGLFAVLAIKAGGLDPAIARHLVRLGQQTAHHAFGHVFVGGIFAGWLVALIAWLVTASERTIAQIVIVWMLAFMLGVAHFPHCIASSGEILSSVANGTTTLGAYGAWLAAATLGNIAGGVLIVALLNYAQVHAR